MPNLGNIQRFKTTQTTKTPIIISDSVVKSKLLIKSSRIYFSRWLAENGAAHLPLYLTSKFGLNQPS